MLRCCEVNSPTISVRRFGFDPGETSLTTSKVAGTVFDCSALLQADAPIARLDWQRPRVSAGTCQLAGD